MKITEEYFNKITYVAQTLKHFVEELREDDVVLSALKSSELGRVFKNEDLPGGDIITEAVLIDVVNCYRFIGHNIDVETAEGFGLVSIDHNLTDIQYGSFDYYDVETDDYVQQHASRVFEKVLKSDVCQEWYEKKDLLLGFVLSLIDNMLADRYVLRLLRFFEAVAVVDGIITNPEAETLKSLAPLKLKYVIK